ncbi:MAG: hypothetical protein HFJ08_01035 [Lachnospiraceae bacterium]|jgi:hypothetical protein|nr:hypothetical protein [Lachnospiraceae bacterium]MCI9399883.1 hypothetical protein [Lachnospiraceae bacterium]
MDYNLSWYRMPIGEQISNVGSEVHRAIRWKKKGDKQKKINFCKKAIVLI